MRKNVLVAKETYINEISLGHLSSLSLLLIGSMSCPHPRFLALKLLPVATLLQTL